MQITRNLMLTYRILNDDLGSNMSHLFFLSRIDRLREHSRKVQKPWSNHLRLESRLSLRVVNYRNSLPEHVDRHLPLIYSKRYRTSTVLIQVYGYPFVITVVWWKQWPWTEAQFLKIYVVAKWKSKVFEYSMMNFVNISHIATVS